MKNAEFTLANAVDALGKFYGPPRQPPSTDPFELVLYENVAYLAPDERRLEAFNRLRHTIGTRPESILKASKKSLEAVTSLGILKGTSASKLRRCAEIARDEFDGDLAAVIRKPVAVARRQLQRFPGIGVPGAEKILLFAAGQPFLAPDSNGLRVLTRVGFIEEESSYARSYSRAQPAAASFGSDATAWRRAHLLLRLHGQSLCKRSKPRCPECPLRADCRYAQTHAAVE